ncbi:MAG TPA: hypothetical protein PKL31_03690 [Fulvivirga sp.]|nr:hypothetical protein [Fulvivirga sp.]
MKTKFIMGSSALFMALLGSVTLFLPEETLTYLGADSIANASLTVSIMGAMYLGFAFLNWYTRSISIGGIYARPLAMGNFMHFAVGAVTLAKMFRIDMPQLLIPIALIYVLFALAFGWILFFKRL